MRCKPIYAIVFILTLTGCNSCNNEVKSPKNKEDITPTIQVDTVFENTEREHQDSAINKVEERATKPVQTKAEKEVNPIERASVDTIKQVKSKKEKVVVIPFIKTTGQFVKADAEFNLASFAVDEVALKSNGECSENCGKKMFAINYNNKKAIEIIVKIESDLLDDLYKKYILKPEQSLEIGCNKDCTVKADKIKWHIVSAQYKKD